MRQRDKSSVVNEGMVEERRVKVAKWLAGRRRFGKAGKREGLGQKDMMMMMVRRARALVVGLTI